MPSVSELVGMKLMKTNKGGLLCNMVVVPLPIVHIRITHLEIVVVDVQLLKG